MTGWTYKRQIEIDNRGNTQSLNGCQVKVILSSSNFSFSSAKSDGADIRFTLLDESTLLDYYIESYSQGSQTAVIWVKLTSAIVAAAKTSIYVHYGNAAATAETTNSVWTLPAVGADSCTHIFDGVNSYSGVLDTWTTEGAITIHFTPAGSFQNKRLFTKVNTTAYGDYIDVYVNASNKVRVDIRRASGTVKSIIGATTIVAGVEYGLTFSWNSFWKVLYLDNKIEGRIGNISMPQNGSIAPFASGQSITHVPADTTGSQWPGTIIHGGIFNTFKQQQHARALHERRKFYYKDEESKWVKNLKPVFRYGAGENGISQEPTVIYEGGKYRMWFTTSYLNNFIGYAESTDLVTWTNKQPVMGQGYGGESGTCMRSFVTKFGSTYYIYYQPIGNSGGPVKVATSADGITWTGNQVALVINASYPSGYHSSGVIKIGSTYYMWMDTETSLPYRYYTGFATATNPLGPFTFQGLKSDIANGPLHRPGGNPQPMQLADGKIHIWVHGVPPETPDPTSGVLNLPTEGFRVTTSDLGATHQNPYADPIIRIDQPFEFDQVADLCVFSDGTYTWCAANCVDNFTFNKTEFIAQLGFYRWDGTIDQLTQDLTYSVGTETSGGFMAAKFKSVAGKLLYKNSKFLTTP